MGTVDVKDDEKLLDMTLKMIGKVAELPVVRVNREQFLRKQFASSPHIETILSEGPQSVYTLAGLEKKARKVVATSTAQTSATSFVTGLPANLAVAVPMAGADVVQYFAFAINMAQKIAFLFGEDDLFTGDAGHLPEEAQIRIIAYLGAMFGVSGAAALLAKISPKVGANLGKKVAAQALTKTAWYPLVKKIGAVIGQKITKKTVEKTISKAVPVVGGIVSGGLTYITFRPMGNRLAETLMTNLEGGFDPDLDLNPEFAARSRSGGTVILEGEVG